MTMVYLVPIREVSAPFSLPTVASLDRVVILGLALVWIVALFRGGRQGPRLRLGVFDAALWAFLAVVVLSVVVNFPEIVGRGEWSLAIRALSVVAGYVVLFYVAVTVIRPSELRAFGRLLVVLGGVLAAGLVYQYVSGVNLFMEAATTILPRSKAPGDGVLDELGRAAVTGPSSHGLVAASLLSVALVFAAADMVRARRVLVRGAYVLAFGLLLAGGFATYRKSSIVLPVAAIVAFTVAYPRAILRILPVAAVAVGLVFLLLPGAADNVVRQLDPTALEGAATTRDRVSDYAVVGPDIVNAFAVGRGYGTFDAHRYTLLDNQYLKMAVETGAYGLFAYALLILTAIGLAIAARKRASAEGMALAAALLAALVAIAISSGLYDALGFAQLGYIFFFLSACAVIASKDSLPVRRRAGARHPRPAGPAPSAAAVRHPFTRSSEVVIAGVVVIIIAVVAMIVGDVT